MMSTTHTPTIWCVLAENITVIWPKIAEIIGTTQPRPTVVAMAEVEHAGVIDDLCAELRWHRSRNNFITAPHIESRDPRGIDVGMMHQGALSIDRVVPHYPSDPAAVRPIVVVHARFAQHRLQIAMVHSKSRRSGPRHVADDIPGSRVRFAYGRLLRQLGVDAGQHGIPLIIVGDMNDEPLSISMLDGAGASADKVTAGDVQPHRLYNSDAPGHWPYDRNTLLSWSLGILGSGISQWLCPAAAPPARRFAALCSQSRAFALSRPT